MAKSRGAFDVIKSMGEIVFLLVTSGENQKLPEAVVCRFNADSGVPGFLLFKIPAGVAAFSFLVFKIPDCDASFT